MTAMRPLIGSRILTLRELRVMLDADLAELYGVQTKVLVQAVKRNLVRFPIDFMFQLTAEEFAALRSQTVTSNIGDPPGRGGRRSAPYAFTEQGVAMLSSVLGSPRAIAVNIEIMRTFVRVRTLAAVHDDLAKRLTELEDKTETLVMSHDTFSRNTRNQIKQVFDALRDLMTPADPPKRRIGFIDPEDKGTKSAEKAGKPDFGVVNEATTTYPERVWVGPNFQRLGILVLGESWYGDFTNELATDDGYIRAYLGDRVVDALYTRIANGVGLDKKSFWLSVMFTNYVQRVGPTRQDRPTQDHYRVAAIRLARLLAEHSPRGVWILGKEQSLYSEPIVQMAGVPVEVVAHPSSYGVKHETLRASWEALLAKMSNRPAAK